MTRYAQRTLIQQGTVANWGKAAAGIGVKDGYGTATGGTALPTPPTGYSGVYFTASGTLTVVNSGLFDVLLVAGGGGGASLNPDFCGGGGGGGGIATATVYLSAGTHTATIGAGGAGANGGGTSGLATTLGSLTVGANVCPSAFGGGGAGAAGTS